MKHNKPNFRSKFRIYRSIEALERGIFLDLWHLNGQKPWELCGRSEGDKNLPSDGKNEKKAVTLLSGLRPSRLSEYTYTR